MVLLVAGDYICMKGGDVVHGYETANDRTAVRPQLQARCKDASAQFRYGSPRRISVVVGGRGERVFGRYPTGYRLFFVTRNMQVTCN